MSPDSPVYYLFLFGTCCLYWLWKPSPLLLLYASLLYYGFLQPALLPLLLGISSLTYFFAKALLSPSIRRWIWPMSLLVASPLLWFKTHESSDTNLELPLGLSFYTFHCLSFLIDVSRGHALPRRFSHVLLYVSFFPQLIAGPLIRAPTFFPLLDKKPSIDRDRLFSALRRIYLGLFKKLAIANPTGALVAAVFEAPERFHWSMVALVIIAGRYFIFADFSAYTDIAIGSARLFCLELPENFRRPFASSSISEYWSRWHITLSAWIRDYVFFPLSTTPAKALGPGGILILTFVFLGLWHGFRWTFVLYGLWHGCWVALFEAAHGFRSAGHSRISPKACALLRTWVYPWTNYLLILCPPTILFLARDLHSAKQVAGALSNTAGSRVLESLPLSEMIPLAVSILALELMQWLGDRVTYRQLAQCTPAWAKYCVAILCLTWLLIAADWSGGNRFLYFQY